MPATLDAHLSAQLERIALRRPRAELPFLVTLRPGVVPATVALPFEPSLTVESIGLVVGTMTARQALDLATRTEVERIEHDGQAQALADLAGG
jgi:hypothetical protein